MGGEAAINYIDFFYFIHYKVCEDLRAVAGNILLREESPDTIRA